MPAEKTLKNTMNYFGLKAMDLSSANKKNPADAERAASNKAGLDAVRNDPSYQLPEDWTPPN